MLHPEWEIRVVFYFATFAKLLDFHLPFLFANPEEIYLF